MKSRSLEILGNQIYSLFLKLSRVTHSSVGASPHSVNENFIYTQKYFKLNIFNRVILFELMVVILGGKLISWIFLYVSLLVLYHFIRAECRILKVNSHCEQTALPLGSGITFRNHGIC
jgi:hypothetical protein